MAITEQPAAKTPLTQINAKPATPRKRPEAPKFFEFHRLRKMVHLVCVLIFFLLPLSNLVRFDIPRQRFYFMGGELWISEFGILFLSMMFLLFVIAATSIIYGRIYCGYLCPQMIFSEAADSFEREANRLLKKHTKLGASAQKTMGRAILYFTLLIASVVLAFVFIAYFVEPRDLLHRLMSFDIRTAGGIAGAATTLLTFLDFSFLRQRFCTTVCPYGYLQGILGDGNTLLVHYRDPKQECIECKKCVRVCEMGIDIRKSPFQIECIHCADCIDACYQIMGKLGKTGLIHYSWGDRELPENLRESWFRRIGIRDAKRVIILLIIAVYGLGLYLAISMRQAVLVRVAPDRTTMYQIAQDGTIANKFRLQIANRGREQATVVLQVSDLPGATLANTEKAIVINPGSALQTEFEVLVPPNTVPDGVNHFRIVTKVGNEQQTFPQTFITPGKE
jgi:polyferredoxin